MVDSSCKTTWFVCASVGGMCECEVAVCDVSESNVVEEVLSMRTVKVRQL